MGPGGGLPSSPYPSLGRMMAFVDGENLTIRYEKSMAKGRQTHPQVSYKKNAYVWAEDAIFPDWNQIVRATYYTSCQGDSNCLTTISQDISKLKFQQFSNAYIPWLSERLGNNLRAKVFKKPSQERSKGVDIQITIDILTNTFNNNLDTVFIVSGDGDYAPVLEEVIRHGKRVYVAALSSGLNRKMVDLADKFYDLDAVFFAN
jgi:uncharacterized LabA/DUF88 family protein